ncbi:MAG: choice-of-anchor B family protein [Bacteroidetes bacterium]|nr:choice-of-anchor B family protein [Bacteroidota bacterium]MDA0904338.1 choice-of-anchor B family protein [Bacteroidota bacterium]MDA1243113.1 choice-of-anchor B family protein [Bacteroidota bacterium]
MHKKLEILAILACWASWMNAQSPCVNGMAAGYPCSNVELMAFIPGADIGGGDMNDVWGWVDPVDGQEYAIVGRTNGTAFVNISDPVNPVFVANLPTQTTSSLWRDIKVFNNHAFIVSEASGHGMQVVDLTTLASIAVTPQTLTADALYTGWGNAHNIVINEATGRAYGVGTNTFQGGLHVVDISDPTNPVLIGEFSEDGYTHDAQVVSYQGPDVNYQGKEIAFCCNENTVTVVDVTDPTDAVMISSTSYDGASYTHQGWLTEDHTYFISNDELDEQQLGVNTTSFIWDMSDLSSPALIGTFVSQTSAIDHNMYVRDSLVYQSNYRAGLRVLNAANIGEGQLEEVGFFDVYPSSDAPQFNGTWSNYPYFPSGIIAVTHIEEGLFLLRLSGELSDFGCMDSEACNFDPSAMEDDGSCVGFNECGGCEGEELFCIGCTDSAACNYAEVATIDDGSCSYIEAPAMQSATQTTAPVTFVAEPGAHWFETATSPEILDINESYTMPFLTVDGSVWVSNSNGEYGVVGGKSEPDFGNGQYHFNNGYWMVFDTYQDVLFESVDVYSEAGGNHILELLDSEGVVMATATQELNAGLNVFALDFELPAGSGYQLRSGMAEPFLWREDDGADVNYPYEIGSLASITSTTISGPNQYNYYYFFYNWRMSSIAPCLSSRTEFTVTVEETEGVEMPDLGSRRILGMLDVLGREVRTPSNQLVIILYSDGSVEKKFVGEHQ